MSFRCLGIYLGHDKQANDKQNFDNKVNHIEIMFKQWEKRNLSLFGKVQIIKTFALSKLVLPATINGLPK